MRAFYIRKRICRPGGEVVRQGNSGRPRPFLNWGRGEAVAAARPAKYDARMELMLMIGWGGFAGLALGMVAFIATSIHERKWRAVRVAGLLFFPLAAAGVGLLIADYPGRTIVMTAGLGLGAVLTLLLIMPIGVAPRMAVRGPQDRVDEREVVFHRFNRLKPGTPEFEEHYGDRPEVRLDDEKTRALPRLGQPGSRAYHPLTAPFQVAMFDVIERMASDLEWSPDPIEREPVQAAPDEFTRRIKGFARYLGADLVGTTKLNPAYVYSHIGRSPGVMGEPIVLDHPRAIVVAAEMDHDMVRHAPESPTTTETAFKYFEVAKVAMLTARYINMLGYEARAHVDGNYRVMCGPIAVDAGLGELGRLGLIITPEYGPRVRLAVVTTNLPLVADEPIHFGVQHFCDFCKKCAENCPSQSIEAGHKSVYRGVEKWQSDQDGCYRFWRMQGSDCAVCVKVCPYSHPNSPLHRMVRWAISRNALARRVALLGDDIFYGRRPRNRFPRPYWHAESAPGEGSRDC